MQEDVCKICRATTTKIRVAASTPIVRTVAPNPCSHVSASCGKQRACRTRRNRDDRILMTLEHHLCYARSWIPELDTAIFGAAHDPFASWSQTDAQYEVLSLTKKHEVSISSQGKQGAKVSENTRADNDEPYGLQMCGHICLPLAHCQATSPSGGSVPTF